MVARQHPGEAMAEWFVEGFLDRLTDPHDGASMRVLEHAVFYVVSISCHVHSEALAWRAHACVLLLCVSMWCLVPVSDSKQASSVLQ